MYSNTPASRSPTTERTVVMSIKMGMMAMAANPVNVIALAPPLIVTKDEIDEGIAIMDKALEAADAYTE